MGLIAIGFVMVLSSTGRGLPGVVYAGVFIAVVGIYPAFPGNVTWISNNLAGSYKRAAGMAIHIGVSRTIYQCPPRNLQTDDSLVTGW
jgi:hypothetical protein